MLHQIAIRVSFRPADQVRSGFGHDKSLTIRPYGNLPADQRPTLFYAGDGVSDLSAARETDLLFAKKGHGMCSHRGAENVLTVNRSDQILRKGECAFYSLRGLVEHPREGQGDRCRQDYRQRCRARRLRALQEGRGWCEWTGQVEPVLRTPSSDRDIDQRYKFLSDFPRKREQPAMTRTSHGQIRSSLPCGSAQSDRPSRVALPSSCPA
jgi:hypothetical protein